MKDILIGIDIGVSTGVAIYSKTTKKFIELRTTTILKAFQLVLEYKNQIETVYVEDARQVRYKTSKEKAQGAGSVKRDAGIWEEFLTMYSINAKFVRPNKRITKLDSNLFKKITDYEGRTNQHNRDAAMLVFSR